MIVIDLGCHQHEGASASIEPLIERFHPGLLYGFDPLLGEVSERTVDGTLCRLSPLAAWHYDGTLAIEHNGTATRVFEDEERAHVPCFDLANFIRGLPADEEIVLKLDVEHSEYPLLRYLHDEGLDKRLALVWVEWHEPGETVDLDCPVEEWTL